MRALNVAPRPVVSASTFTTSFTGGDIENPDYFPSMMGWINFVSLSG
jgi:hypothetical protein